MNKKYLFGMLVSGAMLAACTADDLSTAPVAQEANPSAPVFTVGFEDVDLQNRAFYNSASGKNKVDFEEGDEMSLFHGILSSKVGTLAGWQNAIYVADEETDGGLKFKTQAMVQPGYAIMVWPADEGFDQMDKETNLGNQPKVRVKQVQKAEDRANVPYISEVIHITIDGKKDGSAKAGTAGTAGYGKDYDILLRRAAGTLQLRLTTENKPEITDADVLPFEIKAVEINMEGANKDKTPFSLALPIKANTTSDLNNHPDYPSWRYGTELDRTVTLDANEGEAAGWIKTEDIENNIATFTLLPGVNSANYAACDGYVKVYTTWGNVVIKHDEKAYGAKYDEDLNTRMATLVKTLWYDEGVKGSEFEGEPTGGFAGTYAKVDLDNLDLHGMHITTEAELITAIKVYESVYADAQDEAKDVTLLLDGDEDDEVFAMSEKALALVTKHMALTNAEGNGLKFQACKDHKCSTVSIANGGAELEVPSLLAFDENAVDVELVGAWSYNGVDDDATTTNVDERKAFVNVTTLINSGTLKLAGTITASDNKKTKSEVKIENYGTVNLSGTVKVKLDVDNYKTINITTADRLGVEDGATLTNMEAQGKNDTGWTPGAVINNDGWLGVTGDPAGKAINNYGIINSGDNARTLISANARTGVSNLGAVFAKNTTAIGTIVIKKPLKKADENIVVGDGENDYQGFIQLAVSSTDPKSAEIGDVANYVVLTGNCAGVTYATDKDGNATNLPKNVKYLEVNSGSEVKFTGNFNLAGLFVRNTAGVNVPQAASVTVTEEIYLKADMALGGTLTVTGAKWAGYHGGTAADKGNAWTTGSGKIVE